MGIIKITEIAGYQTDSEIVCLDCAGDEHFKAAQIITKATIRVDAENRYFCDHCNEQLETD